MKFADNKITSVGLQVIWETLIYQRENFGETNGITRIILAGNSASNCSCKMNAIYELLAQKTRKQLHNTSSQFESSTLSLLRPKSSVSSGRQ